MPNSLTRVASSRQFIFQTNILKPSPILEVVRRSHEEKDRSSELGARYILEGSVRKSGNRVRITGQLIDTETGHHVWAQKYDRVLDDIFTLQDEITEAIVAALEPAVGHAERIRVMQKTTQNLDAWEIYQRGAWHFGHLTRDSFAESYKYFLSAAASDKQFASPLAKASLVRFLQSMLAWSDPREAAGDAFRLVQAAINLDPLDPVPRWPLQIPPSVARSNSPRADDRSGWIVTRNG